MISSHEVIQLIEGFSLRERLIIIERVIKNIREDKSIELPKSEPEPSLLSLAGIMDDEEAKVWYGAVEDARKIDHHEW